MRPADQYAQQDLTRVQSDPAVLYASLELSQSSWLVTSLSPGSEKMSKYRPPQATEPRYLLC